MLTAAQRRLLEVIRDGLAADGVAPTYEEMRIALDLSSKAGARRIVLALEERGFLRRLPNRSRAIEVLRLPPGPGPAGPSGPVSPARPVPPSLPVAAPRDLGVLLAGRLRRRPGPPPDGMRPLPSPLAACGATAFLSMGDEAAQPLSVLRDDVVLLAEAEGGSGPSMASEFRLARRDGALSLRGRDGAGADVAVGVVVGLIRRF